jgi:cold shock CspA family protein
MTRGSVTKIVSSYGAAWGRIRAKGESREVFFNAAALADPSGFSSLAVGQEVEYSELPDPVNGSCAAHVMPVTALPAGT